MNPLRRAVVIGAAVITLGGSLTVAAAPDAVAGSPQTVTVTLTGFGGHATLSTDRVQTGALRMLIDNDTLPNIPVNLMVAQMRAGYQVDRLVKDVTIEVGRNTTLSQAAAAARDINMIAVAVGGGDTRGYAGPPYFKADTMWLPDPGTYYVINSAVGFDPGTGRPAVVGTLHAESDSAGAPPSSAPSYTGTVTLGNGSAQTVVLDGYLASQGTIKVVNHGDTVHMLQFTKVGDDVTDAKVQNEYNIYLAGQIPKTDPAGLNSSGPLMGSDALSVGHTTYLSYVLPPGTYLLQCFVPESITGIPYAFLGMHLVVHTAT